MKNLIETFNINPNQILRVSSSPKIYCINFKEKRLIINLTEHRYSLQNKPYNFHKHEAYHTYTTLNEIKEKLEALQ